VPQSLDAGRYCRHESHKDCIPEVKEVYINFLNHCYIDTEVDVKEIYTSSHMWSLFERSFLVDMARCASATHDRKHADTALEHYVTTSVVTTSSAVHSPIRVRPSRLNDPFLSSYY
jgi:hypothetical protein